MYYTLQHYEEDRPADEGVTPPSLNHKAEMQAFCQSTAANTLPAAGQEGSSSSDVLKIVGRDFPAKTLHISA